MLEGSRPEACRQWGRCWIAVGRSRNSYDTVATRGNEETCQHWHSFTICFQDAVDAEFAVAADAVIKKATPHFEQDAYGAKMCETPVQQNA